MTWATLHLRSNPGEARLAAALGAVFGVAPTAIAVTRGIPSSAYDRDIDAEWKTDPGGDFTLRLEVWASPSCVVGRRREVDLQQFVDYLGIDAIYEHAESCPPDPCLCTWFRPGQDRVEVAIDEAASDRDAIVITSVTGDSPVIWAP